MQISKEYESILSENVYEPIEYIPPSKALEKETKSSRHPSERPSTLYSKDYDVDGKEESLYGQVASP